MLDTSTIEEFITETDEHLEAMEANLIKLENQPDDSEILNEIFRSVHTIKGSSEYLDLAKLAELSHKLENLLELLREGQRPVDKSFIDLLIEARDRMVLLTQDLACHQAEKTAIDDLLDKIDEFNNNFESISATDGAPEALEPAEEKTAAVAENSAATAVNPEANTPAPQWGSIDLGDDQLLDDDTDPELRDIFTQQLQESFEFILEQTNAPTLAEDFSNTLNKVVERIKTLKSSGNYMGFTQQTTYYDQWLGRLQTIHEALDQGNSVDLPTFIEADIHIPISHLQSKFPDINLTFNLLNSPEVIIQDDVGSVSTAEEVLDIPSMDETPGGENEIKLDEFVVSPESVDHSMDNDANLSQEETVTVLDDLKAEENNEENDPELHGIFIKQLQENLILIKAGADELPVAEDRNAILQSLIEKVKNLCASANYMGYTELVAFSDRWRDVINQTQETLLLGETFSLSDFIQNELIHRIAQVLGQFPQVSGIDLEPPPADSVELSSQAEASTENQALFDTLSQALETSLTDITEDDTDFVADDLENTLFSHNEPINDESEVETSMESSASPTPNPAEGRSEELTATEDQALLSENGASAHSEYSFADEKVHETDKLPEIFDQAIETEETDNLQAESSEIQESEATELQEELPSSSSPLLQSALPDQGKVAPEIPDQPQSEPQPGRVTKQTLRVDTQKIDVLMNQVGELVSNRARFSHLLNDMSSLQSLLKERANFDASELKQFRALTLRLNEATMSLGRVANDLQEGVMKVRMLPIAQLFSRYPRLVRDLAQETGKKVKFKVKGQETELDKMIIEAIADPMVHIIRNAVDHGIEAQAERQRLGKPMEGTLEMKAYHEGNQVVVEVRDDGRGVDPAKIKAAAQAKNLLPAGELGRLSPKELLMLIMRPGFSTAEQVTHTSGRGVGMDVVKKNLEKLNGTIEIDSQPGKYTCFRLKIPLTLAIIPTMLVQVGSEPFAIPLSNVEETLRVFREEISSIEGAKVIHLRNETLPLIFLNKLFNSESRATDPRKLFVIVVGTGLQKVGLVVDSLLGQQEVVIKPLADYVQEKSGFSGATVLGDGSISLIIDVYELINMSIGHQIQPKIDLGMGIGHGLHTAEPVSYNPQH